MNEWEFWGEGLAIRRACTHLKSTQDDNAPLIGVWGGTGWKQHESDKQHWLTVDLSHYPDNSLSGYLAIYERKVWKPTWFRIEYIEKTTRSFDDIQGTLLYGYPADVLPPIHALYRVGSNSVRQWLMDIDWYSSHGTFGNRDAKPIIDFYERKLAENMPFYLSGIHASLGGWSLPWADSDWDDLQEHHYILSTYEWAEPWVEVWKRPDGTFYTIERIT
jgi:hypothetical protein